MFKKLESWVEAIARRVFWEDIRVVKGKYYYDRYPIINVKLDGDDVTLPVRFHDTDAGADICCTHDFIVPAHDSIDIDTGVHVELPIGTVGMIKSKSGLNIKSAITVEGVIDEGYDGSIHLRIYNHGDYDYAFAAGDKVTQLVVMPVVYPTYRAVEVIRGGDRGSGGMGSTGR